MCRDRQRGWRSRLCSGELHTGWLASSQCRETSADGCHLTALPSLKCEPCPHAGQGAAPDFTSACTPWAGLTLEPILSPPTVGVGPGMGSAASDVVGMHQVADASQNHMSPGDSALGGVPVVTFPGGVLQFPIPHTIVWSWIWDEQVLGKRQANIETAQVPSSSTVISIPAATRPWPPVPA